MSTPSTPAPTATTTILFTDIQNSTVILFRLGNQTYTEQLHGPHLETLKAEVEHHGGTVHQNQGDGVNAYFADPMQAILCAIGLQNAFRLTGPAVAEATGPCRLQARMGLHTGPLAPGGLPTQETLTYAARVMSPGCAEQILLSDALYATYKNNPAYDTRCWPDLFFKGIPGLHPVHELLYDGVVRDEPGTRLIGFQSVEAANSYVPRLEKEAQIRAALFEETHGRGIPYRLVTIHGEGGMGKTRLAVTCARQVAGECPGGVVLVPLASLTRRDPEEVAEAIWRAFGLDPQPGVVVPRLLAFLKARAVTLLILDNLENVICDGVRAFIADLLAIPQVRLLVTSRVRVGLTGQEREVSLNDGLTPDEAAQLFVERAREQTSTLPPSPGDSDLAPLMELACHIPLAIELIAAWWHKYPQVKRLRERYEAETFSILSQLPPNQRVPGGDAEQTRHRSLEASLHWSWRNLGEEAGGADAQAAFIAASLFADTFDDAGVMSTLAWPDEMRVINALSQGLNASLFRVDTGQTAPTIRYRMHRFTQVYGREARYLATTPDARRAALPDPDALRSNFMDYYIGIVDRHGNKVKKDDGAHSRVVLNTEWRNVGQALMYADTLDKAKVVGLGNGLVEYFDLRSLWTEWETALNLALDASRAQNNRLGEGQTLNHLGSLYQAQGDWTEAINAFEKARDIFRESTKAIDTFEETRDISHEPTEVVDGLEKLRNGLEKARNILRKSTNYLSEAAALNGLGSVYQTQGRWREATNAFEKARIIFQELGDPLGEGAVLNNLGNVYQAQSDWTRAIDAYKKASAIYNGSSSRLLEGAASSGLGNVYQAQGKWMEAMNAFEKARVIFQEFGAHSNEGGVLCNMALLRIKEGRFADAVMYAREGIAVVAQTQDTQLLQQLREVVQCVEQKQAHIGQSIRRRATRLGTSGPNRKHGKGR